MEIEELPDELLLQILSKLKDGRTLLHAVPLVCKRWHALHREPEAWASVRVVDDPGADRSARHANAAVVLHAPYLDCLSTAAMVDCVIYRALRRSRCVVREFRTIQAYYDPAPHERVAVMDALYRSRNVLTVAELVLCSGRDSEGRNMLQVIAALGKLQVLVLRSGRRFPYRGELEAGLPSLLRFEVREGYALSAAWRRSHRADMAADAVSAAVVRAAAATLRVLHLVPLAFVGEGVFYVFQGECLATASTCSRLRSLEVCVESTDFKTSARVEQCVASVLSVCRILADSARRLAVVMDLVWHGAQTPRYDGLAALCEREAVELRRANARLDVTLACTVSHAVALGLPTGLELEENPPSRGIALYCLCHDDNLTVHFLRPPEPAVVADPAGGPAVAQAESTDDEDDAEDDAEDNAEDNAQDNAQDNAEDNAEDDAEEQQQPAVVFGQGHWVPINVPGPDYLVPIHMRRNRTANDGPAKPADGQGGQDPPAVM